MVIHKNFADFVLFLFIHMAYADGEFHPTEKVVILDKMRKLFSGESNPLKKMETAEKDITKVSEIILDTFKHFKGVKFAAKYHVYTDMYDIVLADGKVDDKEAYVLEELKKIIDLSAEAKT